jgi:hypothetical protein
LALIVTHGWPGSIIEQSEIIEPLTNPTPHGASASDAFHIVILFQRFRFARWTSCRAPSIARGARPVKQQ